MMNTQKTVTAVLLLSLIFTAVSTLEVSLANPLRAHEIDVNSPQNDYVYGVGDVPLRFTTIAHVSSYYSSFSYSLDGQELQVSNGDTTMHNLSVGSHRLAIYGKISSGYSAGTNALLTEVYFSVYFPSNWLSFILALSFFVVVFPLLAFVNRRRLLARLRGKKNALFWFGLLTIILAAMFVIPFGYKMLNFYLFPYDTRGSADMLPTPFVLGGLVVIGIGLLLLTVGTLQIKFPKWEPHHPKKKQEGSMDLL
jgi:hypothetical protein